LRMIICPRIIKNLSACKLLDFPHGVHNADSDIIEWGLDRGRRLSANHQSIFIALLLMRIAL